MELNGPGPTSLLNGLMPDQGSGLGRSVSLMELDARAREVFRQLVETYLQTGEPVGSRTLSRGLIAGSALSPASIRNTMQDLTELGLLSAAHMSAGRFPTHHGLRLFVDGLMEVGDVPDEEKREIESRLTAKGLTLEAAMKEATSLLSGLVGGAGMVLTPVREAAVRHVEFVSLGHDQALAVIVYEDGGVENRLMNLGPGVMASSLSEASNFMNARLRGRTLAEAKLEAAREVETARRQIDETAARLVAEGLANWSGGEDRERALIVRGRAHLIDDRAAVEDLERVRQLFDDLEQKEQLISLLDDVRLAQGVRIFIGSETRLFSLSGSSVIAAPYMTGRQRVLGAIGVIGPTRLNYARVIPLVDYTARILGQVLDRGTK